MLSVNTVYNDIATHTIYKLSGVEKNDCFYVQSIVHGGMIQMKHAHEAGGPGMVGSQGHQDLGLNFCPLLCCGENTGP